MDKHSIVHDSSCTKEDGDNRAALQSIRKIHRACRLNTDLKEGLRKQIIDALDETDENR